MNRPLAVLLALLAAVLFSLASALQHRAVRRQPVQGGASPKLLVLVLRDPGWLIGGAADVLAVGAQTAALRFGPVALVQPLLVLGLPLAVVGGDALARRRPSVREVLAAAACAVAVVVLVLAGSPAGGVDSAGAEGIALLAVVTAAGLALAAWSAGQWGAVGVAAGAGLLLGAASVALRIVAAGVGVLSLGALLPAAAVLVVAGPAALVTTQAAFQRGRLAVPLSVVTLVEPATAVALALPVLHEHLDLSGARPWWLVAAVALAVLAVLDLARQAARQ